ncbi:MAG: hypothetical protein VCE43_20850 [Myxococcota bacterium]
MRTITLGAIAALSLMIASAGLAGAANADTDATGPINALDVNQGSGTQVNADVWEDMDAALAGNGNQGVDIEGEANTGSGSQDNSETSQNLWSNISNANAGSGTQLHKSSNSNGGDRTSNDIVMSLGDTAVVANGALEASVSGNSVTVSGSDTSASSGLSISDGSGFSNMNGVNAIALSSGHNSSQNVNVNVTASVSTN